MNPIRPTTSFRCLLPGQHAPDLFSVLQEVKTLWLFTIANVNGAGLGLSSLGERSIPLPIQLSS